MLAWLMNLGFAGGTSALVDARVYRYFAPGTVAVGGQIPMPGSERIINRTLGGIRSGNFFTGQAVASLAAGADLDVLLRTPDNPIEFVLSGTVFADTPGDLFIFENPTVTADGTPFTLFNHNRRSTRVATILGFTGPTLTADGTELVRYTGSVEGELGQRQTAPGWEILLDRNQEYLLRFTSDGPTNDTTIHIHVVEDATRA